MNSINSSFVTTAHAASHAASMTNKDRIQKGLTLASVVVAAISHVPSLRFASALALRTFSFLSASVTSATLAPDAGMLARVATSYKTGVACLGVAAIAVSSPALFVATLVSSVAIQYIEILTHLSKGAGKDALKQFAGVLIDCCVLAGVIVNSPTLLVTATAMTAVAMTAFAVDTYAHSQGIWDTVEAFSYAALALFAFKQTVKAISFTPAHLPAPAPASAPALALLHASEEQTNSYTLPPQPAWLQKHNEREKHVVAKVFCGGVDVRFYDDGKVVAKPPMIGAFEVTDGRYDHCNPLKKS